MEGLVTFLLFGALFYIMMRYGCGAHMVHGHGGHGGHGSHEEDAGHGGHRRKATDPVCGMEVEPGQGYAAMYEGQEYRFCSKKCLDKFDAEPASYASQKGVSQ